MKLIYRLSFIEHILYLCMKKLLFISLLFLVPILVLPQKVTIQVIKENNAALSDWHIFDENYFLVFPGDGNLSNDTVTFSLEANKRYFFQVSLYEIYNRDFNLYTLSLNNETIILINPDITPGDHFFPFFTGIHQEDIKITGGTDANIADFPWQVYFKSGNYLCGGSIINEDWILTAAHCTENSQGNPIPVAEMFVIVGATNPYDEQEGQEYKISEVIVNSGYNNQTLDNDIALLKVKQPINNLNAGPIKLVTTEDVSEGATDPGVMSWVTGWGLTRVDPDVYAVNLQKVQLPIVNNEQASVVWNTIPSSAIIAGYLNGNKDACSGDSGGPLAVPVYDDYKLAGIVSWGSSDCDTYGGYTRVSDFETWIRSNTGIAKEYWPPDPVGDVVICQGEQSGQYSISNIPGATDYEWRILPEEAGIVNWDSEDATVLWNTAYTGPSTLIARVTIDNIVSEWSNLDLMIVKNTNLLSQSGDTAICEGDSISLDVITEGDILEYKWYNNEQLIQSGSTAQLDLPWVTPVNSGEYICEVSGSCGTIYSEKISLTVYPLTKITGVSPDIEIPFGNDGLIEVYAEGHDLTYQWQKDNTLLLNSNLSGLMLDNLNASDIGLYRATVTGTCGIQMSDSIYVYVKRTDYSGEPEVFLWPSPANEKFNIALSNDEVYNILVYDSMGRLISEQDNCRHQTVIDISNRPEGIYIISVFNNNFRKSLRIIKD